MMVWFVVKYSLGVSVSPPAPRRTVSTPKIERHLSNLALSIMQSQLSLHEAKFLS